MIIVTGSATAREGAEAQMEKVSIEHVLRSRTEPGCISHAVSRDVEDPRRFVFVERWADMTALQVHFRLDASRQFAKDLTLLADGKPDMALYQAEVVPLG
jgi:quinol monooxygenase YgiN